MTETDVLDQLRAGLDQLISRAKTSTGMDRDAGRRREAQLHATYAEWLQRLRDGAPIVGATSYCLRLCALESDLRALAESWSTCSDIDPGGHCAEDVRRLLKS